jgi:hypothetical protein
MKDKFYCIVCGKEIKPLYPDTLDYNQFESNMWDGGLVTKVTAPYGSKFDSDIIFIGLCDDCIEKKNLTK